MVGHAAGWNVEPVVNPSLREAKRQRLIRTTNEQIAGRRGPVRQIRHRDEVVSPLDLASSSGGGTAGPMTTTILLSQHRAIEIARDATTARIAAIEQLAAQVAAAEAARQDWETAHRMAANNDKYLDLVARTAVDQRATVEITDLAQQAAQAAHAFRETLQRATLAAEALALPESR